jgi:hypothetical protein
VYLEQAEAREMLYNYNSQDPVQARKWLEARIAKLCKIYGAGFDQRVRVYMRQYQDEVLA